MNKKVLLISGVILAIALLCIYIYSGLEHFQIGADKKIHDGIKIILIGGSNEATKENINSMGYLIITRTGKTIIIDGGRDVDSDEIKTYIDKYSGGVVNHWIITHGHSDHVGAFVKLMNEDNTFVVENVYYSLLSDEWYKENDSRGYESEHALLESLKNEKIKNQINCKAGQIIEMDNIDCEIIREANPEITYADNGNEASMVFKLTAKDVNKSVIFFGDAGVNASKELLAEDVKGKLKADAVQMSHHGQNGVTKEVYDAVKPEVCFFNCPKWLWENDCGRGYNSGGWQTIVVRGWMEEYNTTNYMSFEGDQMIHVNENGFEKISM